MEVENDASKLFSTTRNLLGWQRAGPPTSFLVAGKFISKQKDIAEAQADYYYNKVLQIKNSLPRVNYDPMKFLRRVHQRWNPIGGKPKFSFNTVTQAEVHKMIKALKNSQAYGHDDIDATIIKLAAPAIVPAITHIINLSLGTNTFAQKWKIARVLPLLKSSDSDKCATSSYRPVAQLGVISKLVERSAQSQLLHYLETTKQIAPDQHAYRVKCSTTTALVQIMDTLAEGAEENMITATVSVDQSAAFDCVEHNLLMDKLSYYGLDRDALNWIKSYLELSLILCRHRLNTFHHQNIKIRCSARIVSGPATLLSLCE